MISPTNLPVFTPTSPARTKAGRLRELFDQIEQAQAEGWRQEKVVEALREQSLDLSVDYLKRVLTRIRAERKQGSVAPVVTQPLEATPKRKPLPPDNLSTSALSSPAVGQPKRPVLSPEGYRNPLQTFTRDVHQRTNLDE